LRSPTRYSLAEDTNQKQRSDVFHE
jgi:hypothetical protein